MKQGDKVHVVTTVVPGIWNKPREMVATFIAKDHDVVILSLRPEAGTQELPMSQVDRMVVVHRDTPVMLPRIFRG